MFITNISIWLSTRTTIYSSFLRWVVFKDILISIRLNYICLRNGSNSPSSLKPEMIHTIYFCINPCS